MSRIITLQMLKEGRACHDQVVLFEDLFGDSTPVTEELCVKYASDFDFSFAAYRFLTEAAWDEYRKAKAAAWKEHWKTKDAAWSEYEKARAATLNEYEKTIAPALDEYRKAKVAALNEYKKTKAITFCRLYNSEKE